MPSGDGHIYYRYVAKTDDREALEQHLNEHSIEAKRPVYRPAQLDMPDVGDFPGADDAHARALSLPIHPAMRGGDVARVIKCVTTFFG